MLGRQCDSGDAATPAEVPLMMICLWHPQIDKRIG